jgi:hypothetical protein
MELNYSSSFRNHILNCLMRMGLGMITDTTLIVIPVKCFLKERELDLMLFVIIVIMLAHCEDRNG